MSSMPDSESIYTSVLLAVQTPNYIVSNHRSTTRNTKHIKDSLNNSPTNYSNISSKLLRQSKHLRMPKLPEKDGKQQAEQMELPAQDAGRTVTEQPVSSPVLRTQLHYSNQYRSAQLRK